MATSTRPRNLFPLLFALVAGTLGLTACATAQVPIAENGQARAVIVRNAHDEPHSPRWKKDQKLDAIPPAGASLQKYLQQMTGAEIPLVETLEDAGDRPAIVLEMVDRVPGASDDRRGEHAYRLTTRGNRLTITAGTPLGLQYAVYGLLQDHLGVGFFAPDFEQVPRTPNLTLPKLDELSEPTFSTRSLFLFAWGRTEASEIWAVKNRLYPALGDPVVSSHTYGKYKWGENCPLDPEYQQRLARMLAGQFKDRSADAMPLEVGQRDYHFAPGCDECENCQEVFDKGGNYSDLMVMMFNAALERTAEAYPDHAIITFAYFNTLAPPELVKPHKNLWVNIVSSDYSGNMAGDQLNPIKNNPANAAYEEGLRGWPKVMDPDKFTTWHWAGNHPAHRYEWPNLFPIIEDMKLWREADVRSAQFQIQNNAPHLGYLKNWVWMQMAWDIDRDPEAVVRRFLRGYYGEKAEPAMWEYLQRADQLREAGAYWPSVVRWRSWRTILRQKLLTPEVRSELDTLLARAADAASREDNPVFAAHVADARGRTIDEPIIDGARSSGGYARVTDPRDGSAWYVAGGREDVPARIDRVAASIRKHGGDSANRKIAYLYQRSGHKLHEMDAGQLRADVVPHFQGSIVDLVHKSTGKSLFAGNGYHESPAARDWYVEPTDVADDAIRMRTHLNQDVWSWRIRGHVITAIEPTAEGDGLTIRRSVQWTKLKPKGNKLATPSRWNLILPEPAAARIRIRAEGFEQSFTGDQFINQTQATDVKFPEDASGRVTVEVDRGDGLIVVIETTIEDWGGLRFLPDLVSEEQQSDHGWTGDPQILAGTRDQNARVTDYRWQGPTYWPWDRDMFPVDSRPHLRLQLNAKPVAFTAAGEEAELPRLTVRVRDDGEVREVQAQAATAEQAAPEPVQLERTGDRTAINPKDDAELVFVPAGEFIRGSDEGGPEERPQRDIHLDGYWVYKTPVTVGQYRAFAEATGRKFDPNFTSFPYQAVDLEGDGDNLPVITNWYDAQAYAEWVGGTLPSEAQWEKAARGTDGRTYPWGETWDASRVARDDWDQRKLAIGTHPVGSAPDGASPYGALDMAGNTWEWVGDWYAHDYYERSPGKNPKGPAAGAFRVVRGGDVHSPPMTHRSNFRMPVPPHAGNWVPIGFRVAIPADADGKPRE